MAFPEDVENKVMASVKLHQHPRRADLLNNTTQKRTGCVPLFLSHGRWKIIGHKGMDNVRNGYSSRSSRSPRDPEYVLTFRPSYWRCMPVVDQRDIAATIARVWRQVRHGRLSFYPFASTASVSLRLWRQRLRQGCKDVASGSTRRRASMPGCRSSTSWARGALRILASCPWGVSGLEEAPRLYSRMPRFSAASYTSSAIPSATSPASSGVHSRSS